MKKKQSNKTTTVKITAVPRIGEILEDKNGKPVAFIAFDDIKLEARIIYFKDAVAAFLSCDLISWINYAELKPTGKFLKDLV